MERIPLTHLADGVRCFVDGPARGAGEGLGVRFELVGDHVEASWVVSGLMEGWPGMLHGSAFAALLDDAAAWAMIAVAGQTGFTTRMDIRFLRPLRIGQRVTVRGRVREVGERSGTFDASIEGPEGPIATGLVEYAFLDEKTVERVLGRALSPTLRAWLRSSPQERRAMLVEAMRTGWKA